MQRGFNGKKFKSSCSEYFSLYTIITKIQKSYSLEHVLVKKKII